MVYTQHARRKRRRDTTCASRRTRVLKSSVPTSWLAKCHFGTIWVYCGEHPTSTHHFKYTFSSISKQAESTQICSQRKWKLFCTSCRARMLKKSVPARWLAKCHLALFGKIAGNTNWPVGRANGNPTAAMYFNPRRVYTSDSVHHADLGTERFSTHSAVVKLVSPLAHP